MKKMKKMKKMNNYTCVRVHVGEQVMVVSTATRCQGAAKNCAEIQKCATDLETVMHVVTPVHRP